MEAADLLQLVPASDRHQLGWPPPVGLGMVRMSAHGTDSNLWHG